MRLNPRPALAVGSIVALLWLMPAVAGAQETESEAFSFGNTTEFFLLGGLTGGGSFGTPGGGGFAGGELSAVWLKDGLWGGLYSDAAFDFGQGATTITLGPEFGWTVLGFDGGLGFRFGQEDDPELGYQGRALLGMGYFALFGRYGFWPDSKAARHVGQVGVLMKLPLWSETEPPPIAP